MRSAVGGEENMLSSPKLLVVVRDPSDNGESN
jgi:hypothetical protein